LCETRFWEHAATQMHYHSPAQCCIIYVTNTQTEACPTTERFPLHIASLPPHHIDIGFRRIKGDSLCVAGRIHMQIGTVDSISDRKAIHVPILLLISWFLISLTKLWDTIFHLCICEGRKGHANVVDYKSIQLSTYKLDIVFSIMEQWDRIFWIGVKFTNTIYVSVIIQVITAAVNAQCKSVQQMTAILHSSMHPTAEHLSQTCCTLSRFWKLLIVGHRNWGEEAGSGNVRRSCYVYVNLVARSTYCY